MSMLYLTCFSVSALLRESKCFFRAFIFRFTVFGGLENAIDLIKNFKFSKEQIEYLK